MSLLKRSRRVRQGRADISSYYTSRRTVSVWEGQNAKQKSERNVLVRYDLRYLTDAAACQTARSLPHSPFHRSCSFPCCWRTSHYCTKIHITVLRERVGRMQDPLKRDSWVAWPLFPKRAKREAAFPAFCAQASVYQSSDLPARNDFTRQDSRQYEVEDRRIGVHSAGGDA